MGALFPGARVCLAVMGSSASSYCLLFCDLDAVQEAGFHVGQLERLKVGTADHAGGERFGCMEKELVDEDALSTQDQKGTPDY